MTDDPRERETPTQPAKNEEREPQKDEPRAPKEDVRQQLDDEDRFEATDN